MSTGAAKVILQEWDYSTRVPSYPGVYGAIVLPAKKGKVNTPQLVTSETNFLKKFTPDETIKVGYDLGHYDALSFLSKSNALWVVRAATDATYGGAYLGQDLPVSKFNSTVNLGLSALTIRQATSEEVTTAELVWDSLSDGDSVTVAPQEDGGTLPAPLSENGKYFVVKLRDGKKQISLATTLQKAYDGEIITFTDSGSGSVTVTISAPTTQNGEAEYEISDPDNYNLDSSDGKIAELETTFTVDLGYSVLNIPEEFWNTCATGDACKLSTVTGFPEVSGEPLSTEKIYYIIKLSRDHTLSYKVQIARSYAEATAGTNIEFLSKGSIVLNLTEKAVTSSAVVNIETDTLVVVPNFWKAISDGDGITLTTTGTFPTVSDIELETGVKYYIIKGTNNKVQLSTSKGGAAMNFLDEGNGTLTLTCSDLASMADTVIDRSSDTFSVDETFYESITNGTAVTVESTETLPTGLVSNKVYYVFKDPSGTANKIKLAKSSVDAISELAIDVTDEGTGIHTMKDTHNSVLSGFNRKCMLIYTSTPCEEEVYIKTLHYPYGDESTWSDSQKAAAVTVGQEGCFLLYVYKKNSNGEYYEAENPWLLSRDASTLNGYGTNIYCETAIESSNYVRIKNNTAVPTSILPLDQENVLKLVGGTEGSTVTDSVMQTALDSLNSKRNYSVTVIMDGGWATPAYGKAIISLCENRQDCVGLLSTPISNELSSDYLEQLKSYRRSTLNANTSYAALYTPHLLISDKFNDREVYISPTGFVGGVISNNEANYEIWYAPAGPRYGILSAPLDVARRFNEGDLDELYNNGINPIDFYEGRGIRVWGQKTLQSKASALDRLNVRLMLIYIEPAISEFLEDFLFEINDDITRRLITSGISSYMEGIKARRGVYDYKVICNEDNNTAETIDANELHVWLYVQPTKTVEFIKFRVIITRTGASFDTL